MATLYGPGIPGASAQPPWVSVGSGTWIDDTGNLRQTVPFGTRTLRYGDTIDSDQWLLLTHVLRGDASTLYNGLRYTNTSPDLDTDGCYCLRLTSGGLLSLRRSGGTIGSATLASYPMDILFEAEGDNIRVWQNGILVIDIVDTVRTGGAPAISIQPGGTNTTLWADVSVGDFAAGGSPIPTAADLGLALSISATARKLAGTTATLTLDLSTVDDLAKTGQTDGPLALALAATASGSKTGETTAALGLLLDTVATPSKNTATTAALALALDVAASPTKAAQVAAQLGLTLSVGATSVGEAVRAPLALALAVTATARKLSAIGAALGLDVGAQSQSRKAAAAAATLDLVLMLAAVAVDLGVAAEITGPLIMVDNTPRLTMTDNSPTRTMVDNTPLRTMRETTP